MYLVLMEMSCSSVRRKSFLNSDIMDGDRDKRCVITPTTDCLLVLVEEHEPSL